MSTKTFELVPLVNFINGNPNPDLIAHICGKDAEEIDGSDTDTALKYLEDNHPKLYEAAFLISRAPTLDQGRMNKFYDLFRKNHNIGTIKVQEPA